MRASIGGRNIAAVHGNRLLARMGDPEVGTAEEVIEFLLVKATLRDAGVPLSTLACAVVAAEVARGDDSFDVGLAQALAALWGQAACPRNASGQPAGRRACRLDGLVQGARVGIEERRRAALRRRTEARHPGTLEGPWSA